MGIVNLIWEYKPGQNRKLDSLYRYWVSLGLLTSSGLTPKGTAIAEDAQPLIEYYLTVVNELLSANYADAHQQAPLPPQLRVQLNLALGSYHERVLKGKFWERFKSRNGLLLDVCSGHGRYSTDWVNGHRSRSAVAVDLDCSLVLKTERLSTFVGDVLKDPWAERHAGQASVVLFSEALSMFPGQDRFSLVQRAKTALKKDGLLIVHERNATPAHSWISAIYHPCGSQLTSREVAELLLSSGAVMAESWKTHAHHGTAWSFK